MELSLTILRFFLVFFDFLEFLITFLEAIEDAINDLAISIRQTT
jgi:hypothetical protein